MDGGFPVCGGSTVLIINLDGQRIGFAAIGSRRRESPAFDVVPANFARYIEDVIGRIDRQEDIAEINIAFDAGDSVNMLRQKDLFLHRQHNDRFVRDRFGCGRIGAFSDTSGQDGYDQNGGCGRQHFHT